jgi:hypothetical protein
MRASSSLVSEEDPTVDAAGPFEVPNTPDSSVAYLVKIEIWGTWSHDVGLRQSTTKHLRAKRYQLERLYGHLPGRQGRNLAVTVFS